MEEITKLIPAALVERMEEDKLSLVYTAQGYKLVSITSILLIDEGGVSGFLADQILEVKARLEEIGKLSEKRMGFDSSTE